MSDQDKYDRALDISQKLMQGDPATVLTLAEGIANGSLDLGDFVKNKVVEQLQGLKDHENNKVRDEAKRFLAVLI